MMRCFYTLIFTLITIAASTQEKWDLRQCVDYALANNISVKQADVQARLSKLTSQQVKASLYPSLNGSMSSGYQHGLNENPTTGTLESSSYVTGSMSAQAGYTIFNWGARKNNITANQRYAEADVVGIDRTKNDVALFVANAFLQVMLRREQVRISQVQVDQSKEQLNITRKLVDAGSQPELNAIQIEAQLARDSSGLLQSQALAEQALINLKAYLNVDMAQPFDIVAPPVEMIPVEAIADLQPEMVYVAAISNQPQQRMTSLRIEGAEYQVKAARAAMYPTVGAYGGLNTRYVNAKTPYVTGISAAQPTGAFIVDNGGNKIDVLATRPLYDTKRSPLFRQLKNNFGQSIGVGLSFPIFNSFNTRTQWQRARVNVDQLKLQDQQERLNLKTNIYNAYQDAFSSLQKYNASVRTVQASEKALEFAKKRYDIGLLGTLDYITTQNNLFRARIEAVSNHYDFVFKMKVLEFYKGLGIRL